MNLFGWKGLRALRRPPLARVDGWWGVAQSPHVPRAGARYVERAQQAYLHNPVAQRCCRMIAEAIAGAPLNVGDARVAALIAARPLGLAPLQQVATHLLLHGNAYVQILPGADDFPAELFVLRPERVQVVADGDGWPTAYVYRHNGGDVRIAAMDGRGRAQILHIRLTHPADDHYGASCLGAAAGAVAVHDAAAEWNLALLANAARPSGALIHTPPEGAPPLSDAQVQRLRADLEAQFQGSGNAGRPLLLEGGLSWQALSLTPAEMDFLSLKDSAARDIAMAFGVPPMLIGISGDATYANYREASKALWRQTILPLAEAILAPLRATLAPWGLEGPITIDLDKLPALAEDRERLWAQLVAADFLSADEKRAMLGLAPVAEQAA